MCLSLKKKKKKTEKWEYVYILVYIYGEDFLFLIFYFFWYYYYCHEILFGSSNTQSNGFSVCYIHKQDWPEEYNFIEILRKISSWQERKIKICFNDNGKVRECVWNIRNNCENNDGCGGKCKWVQNILKKREDCSIEYYI